jgi:hypothetical protein
MRSDPSNPLLDEPSILPGADVIGVIDPAREYEVIGRAAPTFNPSEDVAAGGFKEFELNGPAGLLLNDDRPRTNPVAADKFADPDFDDITSAQLTVYREIEHRAVTQSVFAIQPKSDRPDLLRLQRAFGAKLTTCVPRPLAFGTPIDFRMCHNLLPPGHLGQEENVTP